MILFFLSVAVIVAVLLTAGFYVFSAYVMFRIGDKFLTGTFREFLIPVHNVLLMCDCAGITRFTAVLMLLPPAAAFIIYIFAPDAAGYALCCAAALFSLSWIYLWGSVAARLGKNFWLWGVMSLFSGGIPILFLAFDSSLPKRR